MHMLLSDSEKRWVELNKFGWPVKKGCPEDIKKSIEKKKQEIDEQEVMNNGVRKSQGRSSGGGK